MSKLNSEAAVVTGPSKGFGAGKAQPAEPKLKALSAQPKESL
jgi:hypothetical protein